MVEGKRRKAECGIQKPFETDWRVSSFFLLPSNLRERFGDSFSHVTEAHGCQMLNLLATACARGDHSGSERLVLDFLGKQKVQYLGEDVQKKEALVKTTMSRMNEAIPVDYSLTQAESQWLVHDVKIDGVSIVDNYRKSFTRTIKQENIDGLLKKMRLQQQAVQKAS